jgi:hypothetical protein
MVAWIRGHGILPGSVLSRQVRTGGGDLLGDTQPPTLHACGGIECLSTCITDFYIEYVAFYYGTLTLCGKCCGTYVCIPDLVTKIDNDGMGPCTRVYTIGCAWASATFPYHHRVISAPIPEASVMALLFWIAEAPEWEGWTPESLPGRGR